MLRLGTCLYNFIWEDSLCDAVRRAGRLGFRAIEIMATAPQLDVRTFTDQMRNEVLEAAAEFNLEILSLNPTFIDLNLASRNDTFRRESVNEVKACIDVAASLGAKLVVIGPGRRHPLVLDPLPQCDSLAHPAMRECIEHAASRGIVYGFENITGLYMTRSDEIAAFIDDVDSPYCKAVYDVANARLWEDPVAGILNLGNRIAHVHLSDSDGSARTHWPIGMGDVDFAGVADALDRIGYQGWSVLETTWMDDPDWACTSSAEKLAAHGWVT